MWQNRRHPIIAAALIAFFVIAAAMSVWKKSSTWDEPLHLTAGIVQLQTGDTRLSMDHPPLARLLAALPALFMNTPVALRQDSDEWKAADIVGTSVSYFHTIEDRLLWPARLMMLVFAVLLGWVMYDWGSRLFGPGRAWLPLALLAFCPVFLANAPLVVNDMAATALIFVSFYTWWRYLQSPSLSSLGWTCISVAAAFATKFTALLLIPSFLFLGVIALAVPTVLGVGFGQRLRIVGGGWVAIMLVTLLGIDLIYFFDGVFLTPPEYSVRIPALVVWVEKSGRQLSAIWPAWLPVPLPFSYVSGLLGELPFIAQHQGSPLSVLPFIGQQQGQLWTTGQGTYFLGEVSSTGWSNYYLMLMLVKLPLSTSILIGLGASKAVSRLPREWWNVLFLALPPLLLIWVASGGAYQIGIRHIMPALPFLFLLAGYVFRNRLQRWHSLAIGALAAMSGLSSLSVHPDYLMYFNFLGGGPDRGWRISINGDDWGQGDADLARWLQARGVTSVAFLANGWGENVLYRHGIGTRPVPCEDTGELVAVHARMLLVPKTGDEYRCYQWMRLRPPEEKIGHNIFIYNSKNLASADDVQSALLFQHEGFNLYNAGKYRESIAASMKSLQFMPNSAVVFNNLCAAYNDLGEWQDAIQACSNALALQPDFGLAKNNLAWARKMSETDSKE